MTDALYKIVALDGSACHGGSGRWSLPNGKAGKWMPKLTGLVACEKGYHLCRVADLPTWVRYGSHLYRAEWRGERLDADDKVVVGSARLISRVETWTDETLRTWATECALRAVRVHLPPALRALKIDEALVVACETAQTLEEARAASYAAGAASYAAGAASNAAGAASYAARAASNAAGAASYAAWAASDAAWAASDAAWAASDAAWAAERRWQAERLVSLLGIDS